MSLNSVLVFRRADPYSCAEGYFVCKKSFRKGNESSTAIAARGTATMSKSFRAATLAVLILSTTSITACASHQETTRTTVTTADANASTEQPATTTTTTETTDNRPDSVLGATLHAVGTVILFPFRLVGDAIGLLV
jgi:hypothetical protein